MKIKHGILHRFIIFIILLTAAFILTGGMTASAGENRDAAAVNDEENPYSFDKNKLRGELTPEEAELADSAFEGDAASAGSAAKSAVSFFTAFTELLIGSFLKSVFRLIGLVLIASVLSRMGESLTFRCSPDIYTLAEVLLISIYSYGVLDDVFNTLADCTSRVNSLMTSYGVVMGEIYLLGGSISSAAASGGWLAILLEICEKLSVKTLLPVLKICFSVTLASAVSQSASLRSVSSFMRNAYVTASVFFMTLVTVIMSFQTTIAASADSVAQRSIKFAASSSVPIIGGLVSESVKTLSGGISVMKSYSGYFCIICLIAVNIVPLAYVFAAKYSFSVSASFAGFLGVESARDILGDCEKLVNYTISAIVITDIFYIYFISVFMSSAVAFAGGV